LCENRAINYFIMVKAILTLVLVNEL